MAVLINLKDARKKLNELEGSAEYNKGVTDAFNALFDLPTIEAEPKHGRWIPCSERLPEELREVNITWVNREPEPYYTSIKDVPFTGSGVYYKGKWYWYSAVCVDYLREYGFSPNDNIDGAIEVTAWMPLPEPYQVESTTSQVPQRSNSNGSEGVAEVNQEGEST